MLRNFKQSKTLPSRPMRGWRKKIGPGELIRTRSASPMNSGEMTNSPTAGRQSVDRVLDRELPTLGVDMAKHHEGYTAHVLDPGAAPDGVHQSRDDTHPHPEAVCPLSHASQLFVGHRRGRDDEFLGVGCPRSILEIVRASQVGHAEQLILWGPGVVQDARGPQTVLGNLPHPGDELIGDRTGSHDERRCRSAVLPPQVALPQGPAADVLPA